MSQEVQLYYIRPITEQEKLENVSLINYSYLQYMGLNKDVAILCSIIHYSFIRKYQYILDSIQELITSSKNLSNYNKIANLIKETKNQLNPVQKFFQNLYLIDLKNEYAQNILIELSLKKGMILKLNQSLVNFLSLRFSFLNSNEKFESQLIEILLENNKKFFYLIPQIIIQDLPQQFCQLCKNNTDMIILDCKHKLCCKCIIQKSNSNRIKCCNKWYNSSQLQIKLEQLDKIKELNQRSKALQQYYESTKLSVQNSLKSVQKNDSNKNKLIQADPIQECNNCQRKYQNKLFIFKNCNHKFCYDCMHSHRNDIQCLITTCTEKMDQGEVQNYLMKFEKEIKDKEVLNQSEKQNQLNSNYPKEQERRIFEQCSKCKINLNQKLFQIKKCNHKICNNCLQGIDINFNLSYNCLIRDCNQKFTKQEYKNYIQYLQDLSKLEVIQTNVNISQQNQNHQQFECDNCFKIQKEDIKYVLNCGHIICLTCAIKNSLLRRCCIQASQVEEYQNFRKTIQLKCEGCKNSFLLPNLFELRCGHKFCLICCQKIYSGKIQRCLVESCQNSVYLIENLNKFIIDQVIQESKEIQLKKEENIIQNLNEEPTIDKQRKQIVQKEEAKVIEQTNLNQRNQDQDNKNEEEKSISAQNSVITIKEIKQFEQVNSKKEEILLQPKEQKQIIVSNRSKVLNPFDSFLNMEKQAHSFKEMDSEEEFFISQQLQEIIQAQEKESEFYRGNCTKCNQEFSIFNRKQQINCKLHEIGVCCILIKFNDCPQCEEGLQKQTKKTLIIKKTPLEEEYFFESTIKSSYYNDKPQSYQQTYQGQNKIFLNMEKHIPNQGQEIRRNTTIDSAYKRVLENRQLVDDRTLIRNEIRNHNELTLQRSPPPFQLSHNTNHYNYGKFNLGKIYGQPYREGPLNIRFNSRYPVR